MQDKIAEILLVEDNLAEANLTKEALKEGSKKKNINHVTNGEEAVAYLYRKPPYHAATRPHLILLDLNLPRKDGREVLREIKADPDLKYIPVMILSVSDTKEDVNMAYGLGVNGYIKKPDSFERFIDIAQKIDHFWFDVVTLPRD